MKTKVDKLIMWVIGTLQSLFLTTMSGIFALISMSALIISVIDKDLFSVIASAAAGLLAWITWDVRRD